MEESEFYCEICNLKYLNKNCLMRHNRQKHNIYIVSNDRKVNENNKYICQYCNKTYSHYTSRHRHEHNCKIAFEEQQRFNNDVSLLQSELIKAREQIIEERKNNEKLKQQIIEERKKVTEQNKNNSSTKFKTYNEKLLRFKPIPNFFTIIEYNDEKILDVLENNEQLQINLLNKRYMVIEKMIELLYFSPFTTNNTVYTSTICITNIASKDAYIYKTSAGCYEKIPKTIFMDYLLSFCVDYIQTIYDKFRTTNQIPKETKKCVSDVLYQINDLTTIETDNQTNIQYRNYKELVMTRLNDFIHRKHNVLKTNLSVLLQNLNEYNTNNNNNPINN